MSKNKINVSEKSDSKKPAGDEKSSGKESAKSPNIIRYGVGFDVHKKSIDTCVSCQLETGEIIVVRDHTFNANPKGIEEIVNFLRKYEPISCYLMECTGVYHLALYHALKNAFPNRANKVIAMNPLLLNRRISDLGNHSDKANARSLSSLSFYKSMLKPSYVGSMEFFRLRDLIRSYYKAQQNVTRFKNRITRILHSINIKDAFDLNREWSLQLLDRFASKDWSLREALEDLYLAREQEGISCTVLRRNEHVLIPYLDMHIDKTDRFLILMELSRMFQEQLVAVSYLKNAEQSIINDELYRANYQKLLLVPGIGSISALTILVELGDYNRFKDARAFSKYCGTVPTIYASGEHKSKGHLNRFSNKYIRTALITASGIILNRIDKNTDLGRYAYKQYHERMLPYKKVLVKVSNKLARIIYHILVEGIDYDVTYERNQATIKKQRILLEKKRSLLPTTSTRVLRRNISDFIGAYYQFLTSSSRFQLFSGFKKLIEKAEAVNNKEDSKKPKKKKNKL